MTTRHAEENVPINIVNVDENITDDQKEMHWFGCWCRGQDYEPTHTETPMDWDQVFDGLDRADGVRDGQINRKALVKWMSAIDLQKRIDLEKNLDISPRQIERIVREADHNNDEFVDKEEFMKLVHDKQDQFSRQQQSQFRQYMQIVAYAEEYRWWPPPYFILSMTLLQVILFVIHKSLNDGEFNPECSNFVFDPSKREECWRFLTYMFAHASYEHLFMNMAFQIVVGLPLEMSHGSVPVVIVYCLGVIAGT